jgi:hypothetical protein
MSLDTLNRIFGEALVNAAFCRALLSDPGTAVRGYELDEEELTLLTSIRAGSVDNFARQIIAGLELERGNPPRLPELDRHLAAPVSGRGLVRGSTQAPRTPASLGSASGTAVIGTLAIRPAAC